MLPLGRFLWSFARSRADRSTEEKNLLLKSKFVAQVKICCSSQNLLLKSKLNSAADLKADFALLNDWWINSDSLLVCLGNNVNRALKVKKMHCLQ